MTSPLAGQDRSERTVDGVRLEVLRDDVGDPVTWLEVRVLRGIAGQGHDGDLLEGPVPRGEPKPLAERRSSPVTRCRIRTKVARVDVCVPAQGCAALEQGCGELLVERGEAPAAELVQGSVGRGVEAFRPDLGQVCEVTAAACRREIAEERPTVGVGELSGPWIQGHGMGRWSSWISPMTPKPSLAYSSRGQSSASASRKIRSSPWLRARAIACRTSARA